MKVCDVEVGEFYRYGDRVVEVVSFQVYDRRWASGRTLLPSEEKTMPMVRVGNKVRMLPWLCDELEPATEQEIAEIMRQRRELERVEELRQWMIDQLDVMQSQVRKLMCALEDAETAEEVMALIRKVEHEASVGHEETGRKMREMQKTHAEVRLD